MFLSIYVHNVPLAYFSIKETQIADLQRQLAELTSHKEEYERARDELRINRKQGEDRLTLVHQSLASVTQQMEKVSGSHVILTWCSRDSHVMVTW